MLHKRVWSGGRGCMHSPWYLILKVNTLENWYLPVRLTTNTSPSLHPNAMTSSSNGWASRIKMQCLPKLTHLVVLVVVSQITRFPISSPETIESTFGLDQQIALTLWRYNLEKKLGLRCEYEREFPNTITRHMWAGKSLELFTYIFPMFLMSTMCVDTIKNALFQL